MGQKNSLSQLFPLIHGLSLLHEVPLLTQQLINSLLHWPVQQSNTPSKRKSEATLSPPGRSLTLNLSGWLFDFFFNLILFVSHLSLVYKQLFSGQKATHKLFTKNKAKQGGHIFCCLFDFFLHGQCWQTKCSRQAGRWAGGQPPSPALPCQLEGGCRAVTLLHVI